jgi:DNA-binding transcriptional ArsR family regulator
MAAKDLRKNECCTDRTNLPEEMEAALQQQGGLDRLKEAVPTRENLVPEAKVFNALSDPIRLQIMHALSVIDLCPCLLKDITELSDSKLSYHLNILEEANLISSSPRKRWRIYILTEHGRSLIKE